MEQQIVGELWVVATPLGNLGDLSPRAKQALTVADLILAEDTRRSGLLLAAAEIPKKSLWSFNDLNEKKKLQQALAELKSGKNVALVSDAGTPLLSDPGYLLVRACRKAGIKVVPIPGASAPLTALSASGLPPQPFVFLGFAPRKAGEQKKFFLPYLALDCTIIFFERKDRLSATLSLIYSLGGARDCCIARELTKTYEEFILFKLAEANPEVENLLGEITVIIAPAEKNTRNILETREKDSDIQSIRPASLLSLNNLEFTLLSLAEQEAWIIKRAKEINGQENLAPKALAKCIHDEVSEWSIKDIYKTLLDKQEL